MPWAWAAQSCRQDIGNTTRSMSNCADLAKLQYYFTNLDFPEIRPVVGGSPTTLPFGVRCEVAIIRVD